MKFSTVIRKDGVFYETTAEDFDFNAKQERDFFVSSQKCLAAVSWEFKRGKIGNKKTTYHATIHQLREK